MSEKRKAILALHQEHRQETEQILFRVIQEFSAKENMTAADVSALAAVAKALISTQKMLY